MRRVILAALCALPGLAVAQPDAMRDRFGHSPAAADARSQSERNHLGLLEYCRDQGWTGEEPITLQRKLVATLLGATGQELEAAGRQGLIVYGPWRTTFAESAAAQGITIKFSCEQTALRVLRQEGGR